MKVNKMCITAKIIKNNSSGEKFGNVPHVLFYIALPLEIHANEILKPWKKYMYKIVNNSLFTILKS